MQKSTLTKKNIILCPKNNLTIKLREKLLEKNLEVIGYIDNYKDDVDVLKNHKFKDNETVILYSPNHYKEIIKTIPEKNTLIFSINYIKHDFFNNLIPYKDFTGYNIETDINSFDFQKVYWEEFLKEYKNKDIEKCGYEWGDPNNEKDELGNYKKIKHLLTSNINENSSVLELGILGGKWTKYMLNSKSITCVDINDFFIEFIKNRYSEFINKLKFYISSGDELKGISSESIDFVFCMDTLVRVEKESIHNYIKEIKRVLKKDGKAIIHLPNEDIEDCVKRGFTKINTEEIKAFLNESFTEYILDSKTIAHGALIYINIKE